MVMALIGLIAGWAITRVSVSGYRMEANARLLQNVILGAQQTAVTRAAPVVVTFDAASARVRTLIDTDGDGAASVGESVTWRALDGARFLSPTSTIDGATIVRYLTGAGVIETGNPQQLAIRIAPNGAMDGDVVLYFGSSAGRPQDQRALAITGATTRTALWSHATGAWRRRDY